jgi:hypothetical protein
MRGKRIKVRRSVKKELPQNLSVDLREAQITKRSDAVIRGSAEVAQGGIQGNRRGGGRKVASKLLFPIDQSRNKDLEDFSRPKDTKGDGTEG